MKRAHPTADACKRGDFIMTGKFKQIATVTLLTALLAWCGVPEAPADLPAMGEIFPYRCSIEPPSVYADLAPQPIRLRSKSLAAADFDGDGDADIALTGTYIAGVLMLFKEGCGGLEAWTWVGLGNWPIALAAADLDADGDMDLAVANQYGGGITILDNPGNGHLIPAGFHETGSGPQAILAVDLDADGRIDLVVANRYASTVTVLRNAPGGLAVAQQIPLEGEPNALATGDFDGDGDPDVAVACAADDSVKLLLNDAGTLAAGEAFEAGPYPVAIDAADLNRDGAPDLAVANREKPQVTVLLNDGSGNFEQNEAYLFPEPQEWQPWTDPMPVDIALVDVDLENGPDILSGGELLFNDGTGAFSSAAPEQLRPGNEALAIARTGGIPIRFVAAANRSLVVHIFPSMRQYAGDTNGDGCDDIFDAIAVVNAFGSQRGDPAYDEWIDFDDNGAIDTFDAMVVARYFGDCAE